MLLQFSTVALVLSKSYGGIISGLIRAHSINKNNPRIEPSRNNIVCWLVTISFSRCRTHGSHHILTTRWGIRAVPQPSEHKLHICFHSRWLSEHKESHGDSAFLRFVHVTPNFRRNSASLRSESQNHNRKGWRGETIRRLVGSCWWDTHEPRGQYLCTCSADVFNFCYWTWKVLPEQPGAAGAELCH